MVFKKKEATEYTPMAARKGKPTYMAISAHQDDIEIMATHGILSAFDAKDESFYAVVTTDGAGSARAGIYADYTDEMMKQVRVIEQRKAAEIGEYGGLISLNYTSKEVKSADNTDVVADYVEIFKTLKPRVVYTHNLCDKHDTHVGVVTKVIKALRQLPKDCRPEKVYGCEVWRGLDWVNDDDKVVFDVGGHGSLTAALLGVFDSQIAGGKRYDLATDGRRLANATYFASHAVDNASHLAFAMDLTPLIEDTSIDPADYAAEYIARFEKDVKDRIKSVNG